MGQIGHERFIREDIGENQRKVADRGKWEWGWISELGTERREIRLRKQDAEEEEESVVGYCIEGSRSVFDYLEFHVGL